ncbi:MAG: glycosyltransferase N-terminal domain-containing protein [Desulfovibrionaceae bacterium]|nr:glycosyltransferase N-terminal domain-containing protein [Desulfovibrionaceae bacterium]
MACGHPDPFFGLYGLAWRAALPLLRRNQGLREGWAQRVVSQSPRRAEVWIQAASAGEALLAGEILDRLARDPDKALSVLMTSNTKQGLDILEDAAKRNPGLSAQAAYFPFDAPRLMDRALDRVRPRAAVLLEGELWPAFIRACRRAGTRVLVANARMTSKSLARYLAWPGLTRRLAPDEVLAVSEQDARRYAALFGRDRVEVMPNIKFDRVAAKGPGPGKDNPLAGLVGPKARFVVLGSVREEEEPEAALVVKGLMQRMPEALIGLFPRHMRRVEAWASRLKALGLAWTLRSALDGRAGPGQVILWDRFGELAPAYGLARAAFVGGSLAPLGGQNFLEPLACGVVPVIGPHWSNFAWVGREIFEQGLAREARDWTGVLDELAGLALKPPSRTDTAKAAARYVDARRGGADMVCGRIALLLDKA